MGSGWWQGEDLRDAGKIKCPRLLGDRPRGAKRVRDKKEDEHCGINSFTRMKRKLSPHGAQYSDLIFQPSLFNKVNSADYPASPWRNTVSFV